MKKGTYLLQAREELLHLRSENLDLVKRLNKSIVVASLIQKESELHIRSNEKPTIRRLSRMMSDSKGKAFSTSLSDQCFRSSNAHRIARLVQDLAKQYGTPKFFLFFDKLKWYALNYLSRLAPSFIIPIFKDALKDEMSTVVLPGETLDLQEHIQKRLDQDILVNLNRLGEAVLGEKEANSRLEQSLADLQDPLINYISIKVSNIFSQIHLISWEDSKNEIKKRLRLLYKAAIKNKTINSFGNESSKFVNLDMEEYRDLDLTVQAFKEVLDEAPFKNLFAGIVLQSYLPDSFPIQKNLTEWAKKRSASGGASIKVRIVKGANLAMEKVEASIMGWPQAPYMTKEDVDANFKRMLFYGCEKENIKAVHLGIGSHNLFDISLALVLCYEKNLDKYITLEMLEGMSPHTRRVISEITPSILLYCPASKQHEFHNAISYLIRRLDENTGEENFLRYSLTLNLDKKTWDAQAKRFQDSYMRSSDLFFGKSKTQNRNILNEKADSDSCFLNCPNTDWSLLENRSWGSDIIKKWTSKVIEPIPITIGHEHINTEEQGQGISPSDPEKPLYNYSLASLDHVESIISTAKEFESTWGKDFSSPERRSLLKRVAIELEKSRFELMGSCLMDGGKLLSETDPEISEAVDFVNYYADSVHEFTSTDRYGVSLNPIGTCLIISPWNFPCAIPIGGIASALSAGNCVIFKPASATSYIGWVLANCFWRAGIPKEALQFIQCKGSDAREKLISDKRVNQVTLTGGTQTAESLLAIRPNLRLNAETGGKNAMIVTDLADQDLAIKDLIQSAFGHSGQKCSAASLGVLLEEVYDNTHFLAQLKDAAESMHVGAAYDFKAKIGPMIAPPSGALLKALTTLLPGEKWLVKPRQIGKNPHLWSPGIKMDIARGSTSHKVEFFGPILCLYRAKNLKEAIHFVNETAYGLTSGLQSLDEKEHEYWRKRIQAGNCYINREITGAIVQRQPFGGWKASSFGNGLKAGGPNYVLQFLEKKQTSLPTEHANFPTSIERLSSHVQSVLSPADFHIWKKSVENYVFAWKAFKTPQDATLLIGQDNLLEYIPRNSICLRLQGDKNLLDSYRVIAILLLLTPHPVISVCPTLSLSSTLKKSIPFPHIKIVSEDSKSFLSAIKNKVYTRIRLYQKAPEELFIAAKNSHVTIIDELVLSCGRMELLHYLKERSLSINYHRYGNLGFREKEKRALLCPPLHQI